MEIGMVCSADMLVVGNEVEDVIKRFAGGIKTEPDHLALDEIQKVGAGGNYLQESHALEQFREHRYPKLFARGSYDAWEVSGVKSLADRCSDKVKKSLKPTSQFNWMSR